MAKFIGYIPGALGILIGGYLYGFWGVFIGAIIGALIELAIKEMIASFKTKNSSREVIVRGGVKTAIRKINKQ